MKRDKLIEKIKAEATGFYGHNIEVHTSNDQYPKCWVVSLDDNGFTEKQHTPAMRPSEILAYIKGAKSVVKSAYFVV